MVGISVTHRGKRILEWSLFSILGLLLVASGLLLYYQKSYAGKMYPNVTITGIDVSGKTKKQTEFLVKKDLDNFVKQPLLLTAADKEISVTTEETGLSFDVATAVDRAYSIGRSNKFIPQLWLSVKAAWADSIVSVPFKINKEAYDKFIAEKVPTLNAANQNASLVIEAGAIKETAESPGQIVDTQDLADQIIILASNRNSKKINRIVLKAVASTPEVTLAVLQNAKAQAETYLAKKITLTYETKVYSPSRTEIGKWIVINNGNGAYSAGLNDNAIKTYLNIIAKDIDIQKKDKRINALDNAVIDPGQEGKYVNKDAALALIKSQLSSNVITVALVTTTEAPKEVKVFPAEGLIPGRFPGKYIDVDLAQQKLCRVDGNSAIDCFTISSGKASTPTPTGTYAINNKNPKAWSAQYGLWMPYWQAFIGSSYGIHELPEWPSGYKEGQDHLGTPVSHGCIRLGIGDSQTVYNWTEIGTPVYIHK